MKFSRSHEWVQLEGKVGTIGITRQAKEELNDIVHIELPKVGEFKERDEVVAILESTKAAIDITTPLSGKILEVNHFLQKSTDLLNQDPEGRGWLYKIEIKHPEEIQDLLSKEEYLNLL